MPIPVPLRAAVLAVMLAAGRAAAQSEPLVTDRPDFTESTSVVEPGHVQAEAGYTFGSAEGGQRSHSVGELLLRVGVLSGVELRVSANSWMLERVDGVTAARGMEDAGLGAKVALFRGAGWVPEAALIVASSIPTGSGEVSAGAAEPEAKLALGWELAERVGLASNLNYAWLRGTPGRPGEASGSVSLGVSLLEAMGGYAEYYAFHPTAGDGEDRHYVNGGLTFRLSPDLQLDARVGTRAGGERESFVGVGIAHRW